MPALRSARCLGVFLLAVACGGTQQPSETPADHEESSESSATPEPKSEDAAATQSESDAKPDAANATDTKKGTDVPAPAFKENGSVAEAINAVPQGTPRLNIEQEALGRPLGNVELYEPCKPGNAHFKAKVAVWDGKAVGLDLTTTPKNQKFADCIAERIRGVSWPDKVKSLNVVEYTF